MSWIIHSAKGSEWEKHKYIKRVDGVYYYPDSYEGGRHLPDGNKVRKAGVQHSDYEGEYLAHFGILGMKWGIRRYQNKDGSLTALGRKRYSGFVEYDNNGMPKDVSNQKTANTMARTSAEKDFKAGKSVFDSSSTAAQKLREINSISSDKKRAKKLKKLRINEMTDQELRDAVNRMQLEDNFSRLASERISTGRERTGELLAVAGNLLAIGGTAASIALAIHQLKHG